MRYIKELEIYKTEEIEENPVVNERYVLLSNVEDMLNDIDNVIIDITNEMEAYWDFKSALEKLKELRCKL